jgi:hypothetical protein
MAHLIVLAAAPGPSSGGSGAIVYIIPVFVILVAVIGALRMRRGGPGPGVNYVPRRFRGRLNTAYRNAGWQEPYDADGNRDSNRDGV